MTKDKNIVVIVNQGQKYYSNSQQESFVKLRICIVLLRLMNGLSSSRLLRNTTICVHFRLGKPVHLWNENFLLMMYHN